MKKQMKWGLATLMLLLGIAAVFLFIDQRRRTAATVGKRRSCMNQINCDKNTTCHKNTCR